MAQEADALSCGFPLGYFLIRSIGTNRLLDISTGSIADCTEVILWPETEGSLVEDLRNPNSDNQVFFVDDTGALCSKASGHAIDVQDRKLVLRHRRPRIDPYPNAYSHPLPNFLYSSISGHISICFSYDPSFPSSSNLTSSSETYQGYILTSVPTRKPRTVGDDVVDLFNKVVLNPFSLFGGQTTTSMLGANEENYDIREEELLEEDRMEEEGDDSSPELLRKVRVLELAGTGDAQLNRKALERLRWEIIPLRKSRAGWPR